MRLSAFRGVTISGVLALVLLAGMGCTARKDGAASPSTRASNDAANNEEQPTSTAQASPASLGTRTGIEYSIDDTPFDPLPGAQSYNGVLGDAAYHIEIPAEWSGELVLFAHGFRGGKALTVSSPPLEFREELIADGVAWAASSYSENGYVPGVAADDTLALLDHFEAGFGDATLVYVVGESMGGHVAALLLENAADRVDGAYAVCGAIAGQDQIDYLVSWAMAAEYTSGVPIRIEDPAATLAVTVAERVPAALGPASDPTPAGLQFESIVRELTGGPRPFFVEGLDENFGLNFALLLSDTERAIPASRAATNLDAAYDIDDGLGPSDEEVNAAIRRIEPLDPSLREPSAAPETRPTTARIQDPFLTLHTTGDLLVPISHEVTYLERALQEGTGGLLVQRAIRAPGHCTFREAEYLAGWRDLASWVRDGTRPAGDDLSGDLSDVGRAFTNPIRVGDPGGQ